MVVLGGTLVSYERGTPVARCLTLMAGFGLSERSFFRIAMNRLPTSTRVMYNLEAGSFRTPRLCTTLLHHTTGVPHSQENAHPPRNPPRTLGIGLRQGPTGVHFLVSEVPLYSIEKPRQLRAARTCHRRIHHLQGYLAHKKPPPPMTLLQAYMYA